MIFSEQLWQACEAHYAKYTSLCLRLQNMHQVNVNLLLLAWYLDGQGVGLSVSQWYELHEQVKQWEEPVLAPYRKLRKVSKRVVTAEEYQAMLKAELELERTTQSQILDWLTAQPLEEHTQNLEYYLELFELTPASMADFYQKIPKPNRKG